MNELNEKIGFCVKSTPVLCRIVEETGLEVDISVTCLVRYELKACNSTVLSGVFGEDPQLQRAGLEEHISKETNSALPVIFTGISLECVSYSTLQQSAALVEKKLTEQMQEIWKTGYGVEICKLEVSEIKASEEDEKKLSSFRTPASNPFSKDLMSILSAPVRTERAEWMCLCGGVSKGKFCPECGQKRPERPADGWKCKACSTENHGKFCTECGQPFPFA